MKFSLAPSICGAQGMSANGGPHATCQKVINQTNKLLNKIHSLPLYLKINLTVWKAKFKHRITEFLRVPRWVEWGKAGRWDLAHSQFKLCPTWQGALSTFNSHVQAPSTFPLPPHPILPSKQLPLGYLSGLEVSTFVVWSVLRTMYLEERPAQAQQIGSRREWGLLGGNIS